jgi:hypothetical protein
VRNRKGVLEREQKRLLGRVDKKCTGEKRNVLIGKGLQIESDN